MDKDAENKIQQLQMLEQSIQNLIMQKQNFQAKLLESENALKELDKNPKEIYKIVGNIMVASEKNELEEELKKNKEMMDVRVKNIEKQEIMIKEKAEKLQKEVMEQLK
ncbi:prefoldin subunit beta [archaeon]|nr:prefoldin subunit beta [archaeon]